MENTINEEEVDYGQLDEYIVCAKCGAIHAAKNKNAVKCACGNNFEYSIFRVQKKILMIMPIIILINAHAVDIKERMA